MQHHTIKTNGSSTAEGTENQGIFLPNKKYDLKLAYILTLNFLPVTP